MRLKQLALAVLFSGAFVAPVANHTLAQTLTAPKVTAPATPAMPAMPTMPAKPAIPSVPTPAAASAMTNINTASAVDLDKLPQIGKARAAAIIKGRPYAAPDDLVTKKVLSKGVFDKIKDKITI